MPGARRTARPLLQARSPGCVTAGTAWRRVRGNGGSGSGPRRCAGALEAAGQAAAPQRRDSPVTPATNGAAPPTVHAFPLVIHASVPRARPWPGGLARRRRALEAVEKVLTSKNRGKRSRVACHEHGTALTGFLPRAWDHLVASDGTTRRVAPGVLITSGMRCLQVSRLGGSADGIPGGCGDGDT